MAKKRKSKSKKKSWPFIGMNRWTSNPIDIKLNKYHPNMILKYDNSLDPMNIPETIVVSYDDNCRVDNMRKAAEVHRQARRYVQNMIRPGVKLFDICNTVESKVVELFGENSLKCGLGFPTGLSINNIAAHDSANPNDERIIQYGDVCKVDFGTHVNGNIIDSAFTVAFDPVYTPLLDASKDGTWTGIKLAGPDARIIEISEAVQEAIESYELEIDQKVYPIKSIKNLGGHNIEPYKVHAGKLILGGYNEYADITAKMEAGECYAIETFATTGSGYIPLDTNMECNHYMKSFDSSIRPNLKLNASKKVLGYINKNRDTLPFCTRWVDNAVDKSYHIGLNDLVNKKIVNSYPAFVDAKGTYTSQWEHTIYLHDYGKEILSKGDDY